MIQIQFSRRIFLIIVKTKVIKSTTFMYIAVRYGKNSLRVLGAHIWNSLPENIKCTDSVYELKNFLKGWYGCKCYLCIV